MNLTDQEKERFCQILRKSELKDVCFPKPNHEIKTYFEDSEFQAGLTVYHLENVDDVRRSLDTVLAEEGFEQLKEECIKAVVKSLISWDESVQKEGCAKNEEIRLPEFIYSF